MRTVTTAFQTELDKSGGAQPRVLLEIDAASGTLYYSDQTVVVDAQTYSEKVMEFGKLISQVIPGEEVVRVARMSFIVSNISPVDDILVAGIEVRVYDWYEGLATADKAIRFKGNISGAPSWDDLQIEFSANDIFVKLGKKIGQPVSPASWANVDPDYIGWMIPILIGSGENLECIPIEAGAASTLKAVFNPADTTIQLTSTTSPIAFPNSGTVIVGNDEHVYTGISGDNLTGVPTHSDTIYPKDSTVLEKTNLKFIAGKSFSDTPVKELTALSILPFNSNKIADAVAIDPAYYTIDLAELIGTTYYATVVLTQISAVRKAVSMAITQQPITASDPHAHQASGTNYSNEYYFDTSNVPVWWTSYWLGTSGNGMTNGVFETSGGYPASGSGNIAWVKGGFYPGCYQTYKRTAGQSFTGDLYAVVPQIRMRGNGNYTLQFWWKGSMVGSISFNITGSDVTYSMGEIGVSGNWADFNNAGTYIKLIWNSGWPSGSYAIANISEAWVTAKSADAGGPTTNYTVTTARITDTDVNGDTVADTLLGRLVCNFKGYEDDSSGTYTGTPNVLIEKPPDVISFLWQKFTNAVAADLDLSGTFLDARNNLPSSYKFGFALTWQVGMNTLSAQLAHFAHCKFFISAGLAKFSRILASGTVVKTIDTNDYSLLTDDDEKKLRIKRFGGALEDIVNKVEILYKHNPLLGSKDEPKTFAGNSESPDSSAQTSIDNYEEHRKTWKMWPVRDDTMADDLRDKFVLRYRYPRTKTVFPGLIDLSLLEPSDLIGLTSTKHRLQDNLSEILSVENISQVPKNLQPSEIVITVLDLLISMLTSSDSITISDVASMIASLTSSDTVNISDTLVSVLTLVNDDQVNISDVVSMVLVMVGSDTINISDSVVSLEYKQQFDSTKQFDSAKQFGEVL